MNDLIQVWNQLAGNVYLYGWILTTKKRQKFIGIKIKA